MRKRNIQVITRFNKEEHQYFQKLVKKSGISQEAYIRHLIAGLVPKEVPPPDYHAMMRELHGIGNNLNQIAQKAHVLNVLDVLRYDENVSKLNQAVRDIVGAVMVPERYSGGK